jgi:hypothetical protein
MWTATRCVEPEWLDELEASDPRAMRSRRDLRRVNAWMLQTTLMTRALRRHCGHKPPRALIDLGGGDGAFLLAVAQKLGRGWSGVSATLVDRQDIVSDQTRDALRALGWRIEVVAADAADFLARPRAPADVITANLLLHHFPAERLSPLLALVAACTRTFVACEPRRSALALGASRMLWAIGCNDVTRHDAVASVRAGFAGRELSALWPRDAGWELHEHAAGLFSHCFVARRSASADTRAA